MSSWITFAPDSLGTLTHDLPVSNDYGANRRVTPLKRDASQPDGLPHKLCVFSEGWSWLQRQGSHISPFEMYFCLPAMLFRLSRFTGVQFADFVECGKRNRTSGSK